jgi:hypothetical protein
MTAGSTSSSVVVSRPRLRSEWAWLIALSLAVALFYVVIRAPVIDPPNYLDPWIYTASFVNFRFIYHVFGWTYYPSRLPWVIPGIVVHSIFGPVAAFFVLHTIYFFGGGLFAYLVFRRYFGRIIAASGYALLMLSPLFYDAYSNDYPDGALLTYLFGGVYFGLTIVGSRRPWLRAFWCGFFLAAAVGTNLFAGVVIACLLLLYAIVRSDALRAPRELLPELAYAACGSVVLLLVCGFFSVAYGGPFLFFKPQITALHNIHAADYKAPGASWMLGEPQLLLPVFAASAVGLLLGFTRRSVGVRQSRFALGAAVSTLVFWALLVVWELAFTGDFLETSYYFSMFNVGIALCLASAFYLLRPAPIAIAAVAAAAMGATVITLWAHVLPDGRRGAVVAVVLMVLSLAVGSFSRNGGRMASTVAVALIAFTATYAADAGTITRSVFARGTFTRHRDVQTVAFQLIDFMRKNGLQKVPFQFWYAPNEDIALNGIQSTYLWGITWVGLEMPKVDKPMRQLLAQRKPSALVLLCKQSACHGAPAALAAAGYPNVPLASGVLAAGSERVYVRALRLPKFVAANRPRNKKLDAYHHAAARFSPTARGAAVAQWSFAKGVPPDWSGDAAGAATAAKGAPFVTSAHAFAYELTGPKLALPAGSYTAYARGRVLAGGLDLGALDVDHDTWLSQRLYWYGQRAGFGRGWMATPFTLTSATKVQLIFSNWSPNSSASRWQLRDLRLVRNP